MKTCESCGQSFECGMTGDKSPCWCQSMPLLGPIPDRFKDCLCPTCLQNYVKPNEALREGEDYYLENGLSVFTAKYLLNRGYCCNSDCRHCPYKK